MRHAVPISPINRYDDIVKQRLGFSVEQMTEQYYDRLIADKHRLRHRVRHRIRSIKGWTAERQRICASLVNAIGASPPQNVRVIEQGHTTAGDVEVRKLKFTAHNDHWITGRLYLPRKRAEPLPGLLHCFGHAAPSGLASYFDRCVHMASQGFAVLSCDTIGTGERSVSPPGHAPDPTSTQHNVVGCPMIPMGYNLLWMMIHDARASLDVLCGRPEIDGERIGIYGSSGGGMLSVFTAAMDPRIRAVVAAASVKSFCDHVDVGDTEQAVFDLVGAGLDYPDLLSFLVAPRPTLVIANSKDIWPIHTTRYAVDEAARMYRLHRSENHLRLRVWNLGHAYQPDQFDATVNWFRRWLKPVSGPKRPTPQTPLAMTSRQLAMISSQSIYPHGAMSPLATFRKMIDASPKPANMPGLMRHLRHATATRKEIAWNPIDITAVGECERTRYVLTTEPNMLLPVDVLRPHKVRCVTVLVDDRRQSFGLPETAALAMDGHMIMCCDLRGWGRTTPEQTYSDREGFARSLYAGSRFDLFARAQVAGRDILLDRVRDVRAVISMARSLVPRKPIELRGYGVGALVAMFATLVDRRVRLAHLHRCLRSYRDLLVHDRPIFEPDALIHNLRHWGVDIPDLIATLDDRVHVTSLHDGQMFPVDR